MNSAAIRVGRLLEIRATSYRTQADVAALFKVIGSELAKVPSPTQAVIVADWRYCPVMSEEAAEYALAFMTRNNPRVQRSAALANKESSVAVLQFLRLVRASKHDSRRLFFKESEVVGWLGEVLTEREKARLIEFLNEPAALPGGGSGRHPPRS